MPSLSQRAAAWGGRGSRLPQGGSDITRQGKREKRGGAAETRQGRGAQTTHAHAAHITPPLPRPSDIPHWYIYYRCGRPHSAFSFPSPLPSKDNHQRSLTASASTLALPPSPPQPLRKSSSTPVIRLKPDYSLFFCCEGREKVQCALLLAVVLAQRRSLHRETTVPEIPTTRPIEQTTVELNSSVSGPQ